MWRTIVLPVLLVLTLQPLFAEPVAEAKSEVVTLAVTEEKASVAAQKICEQAGVRILMEKSADVKISASVRDLSIEEALTAICKAGDLVWRKIEIRADSAFLKSPDSLASTVRLIKGLNFPDILVETSLEPESMVHVRQRPAVESITQKARKDMGMVSVYLISNDKAAKIAEDAANTNVAKYNDLQKESLKLFMEMTPEEREQALASGLQLMQQLDANFLVEMTKSFLQNPGMMSQMMQSQTDILFSMSPEDRRAMMRMQMQLQSQIPPELHQILMEDAKVVMEEIGMMTPQE